MRTKPDARVVFTDGFVAAKDFVTISSYLVGLAQYESTRIFRLMGGAWAHFDLDRKVYSLCVENQPARTIYCLGRDGIVHIKTSGPGRDESIADAGTGKKKLGYVTKIRKIDRSLYVCGAAGQIYRREGRGWAHFDEGVLDTQGPPEALDLYNIDGSSEENIFAVGERGMIWHCDGGSWTRLESPTVEHLEALRCVSPSEVYVGGDNGAFFKGNGKSWEDYSKPHLKEHFWSVEVFRGKAYVAAKSGLFVLEAKKLTPVDTGLKPTPDGYRLHANDGVLWSFGLDHLCFYDGKKWTYVRHPDNPE